VRQRNFLILLAATVMAVAMAGYTARRERAGGPIAHEQQAFPGLAARVGDLAWMRLTHGRRSIDFAMVGGIWTVVNKSNYPAAPERMRGLLRGLARLRLLAPKTRRRALFDRLGLGDPPGGAATRVSVQDRMGETVAALLVGKPPADLLGSANRGVYVRRPDDDQTWLARGDLDVTGDAIDWLDRRIIDIPPARLAAVTLTGADGEVVTLRRGKPTAAFVVAGFPVDMKGEESAMLAARAAALSSLELADVKPAADAPAPTTGIVAAAFVTFDGLTITAQTYQAGGADWLALAAGGSGAAAAEAAALHKRLARWVFAIPPARAKLLGARPGDPAAPAQGARLSQ
jgi:hypothetical protein